MNITSLLSVCGSLFLLMLAGYVSTKLKITDRTFSKKISVLVARVGQPFLMIYSLIKLDYSADNLKNGFIVTGISLLCHALMSLTAFAVFIKRANPDERKLSEFAFVFSNCAFVGYPVLESLFGSTGLFFGAFYVITFNVYVWSYGIYLINRGKSGGAKLNIRKILLNTGTLGCAVGIALYVSRLPLPDFLVSAFGYLGGLCTPLSLLVTGTLIASLSPRELFLDIRQYLFCFLKLIAFPTLIALVCKVTGVGNIDFPINLAVFIPVMVGIPSAAFTCVFAEMYDVKPEYAAKTVCLTTLLSPLTIPLVVKICELIGKI